MSERPRTAVPVGLLRSGLRCRHSAATAFRQPSTACSTSLPAQHFTDVRPFQLQAPQSETLSRISSKTRPSVQTLSHVCLKRTCSLDTSAFSALEAFDDNRAVSIYLLTYLLTLSANFRGNGGRPPTTFGDKTRVRELSMHVDGGVVRVILCLAVLIQYRRVTDRQIHTHRQTHDVG